MLHPDKRDSLIIGAVLTPLLMLATGHRRECLVTLAIYAGFLLLVKWRHS